MGITQQSFKEWIKPKFLSRETL